MVMTMESSRRSFDRSREIGSVSGPGLKKPRLIEEQPNPNVRVFSQRLTAPVAVPPASARYSEGNDSARAGGAYQPQPLQQQYQELVSQYKTALSELTFNSKPIITNLTIIAGESLHAAKAIAATICANILEVPSEQKLPSLYLLDSIVKNIGRDYIKYFAARLHEVFCKAYRQVDPSIRSSMKHLFGTWKGVFPPQTLQMIERELGFAPSVNGSSSGTAAARPDAQSQRPPHSIHVNPKYLERQRLQQSNRVKGMAIDVPIPLPNSAEDVVRPDKSASISSGRSWNIPRSHGEALSESVLGRKTSSVYGDIEYGSDILRNSSMEVQRSSGSVGENKSWYGTGGGVSKTISSQRTGLNVKYGLPGYSLSKSSDVDLHLQPMQTPASRSGSAISASWKNSEEEEFMWDMHSTMSDQDVNFSKNSRKDPRIPGDLKKLGFELRLNKPQSIHEVGSSFDTEASSDSPSSEPKDQNVLEQRLSLPWRLQELQSADARILLQPADAPILSQTSTINTRKSVSHSDNLIVLPITSTIPSPTCIFTKSSIAAADQCYPWSQFLFQSDCKVPQFSGNLLPNVQRGSMQKLQPEDSPPSSRPMPSSQLSHQYPVSRPWQSDSKLSEAAAKAQKSHLQQVSRSGTSSTSDHTDKHVTESSDLSSTSSLLAAVMKSGILSSIGTGVLFKQNQDVGKNTPQTNSRPPISNGPPQFTPGLQVTETLPTSPLQDNMSDASNDSQWKDEETLVAPDLPPIQKSNSAKKDSDPISNLLSSLVAKGLISASKPETSSLATPELAAQLHKQNSSISIPSSTSSSLPTSSVTPSSAVKAESLEPYAKCSAPLPQTIKVEKQDLIGLEFKPDVIRELHPPVISSLFDDLQHKCDICHLRVRLKERLDRHLQWHGCKSQVDDNSRVSRSWYANLEEWVSGRTGLSLIVESSSSMDVVEMAMENGESLVPADEDQCICVLCGELFEDFYSQERNKWMFKGAVHMTLPSADGEKGSVDENTKGPIVHVNCLSGIALDDFGIAGNIKIEPDG